MVEQVRGIFDAAGNWVLAVVVALFVLALSGAMIEKNAPQWRGTRLQDAWEQESLLRAGDATAQAKHYAEHMPYRTEEAR